MRKTTKMAVVLAAMSVMVLGAATMVSAAEKQGWVKEGSDWYYYVKDGAVKNQWALSGGVWYFLGEDGKMVTEEFIDNSIPEVVDEEDLEVLGADFDEYYYVDKNGAMVTGWAKIKVRTEIGPTEGDGTAWYYFGANGVMYGETWVKSGDDWYYLLDNGRMATRHLLTTWDSNNYFLGGDGVMITGWYKTKDNNTEKKLFGDKDLWVYADKDGALVDNGWEKVGSAWYYFGSVSKGSVVPVDGYNETVNNSVMQSEGFIKVAQTRGKDVETFYLTKSGAMETGLFKITDSNRDSFYYFADSKGVIQTGVQSVSGKYYFFDLADAVRYGDKNSEKDNYAIKTLSADKKTTISQVTAEIASDKLAKALAGTKTEGTDVTHVEVYKLGTATSWK